jgi:hypothetical protein
VAVSALTPGPVLETPRRGTMRAVTIRRSPRKEGTAGRGWASQINVDP